MCTIAPCVTPPVLVSLPRLWAEKIALLSFYELI